MDRVVKYTSMAQRAASSYLRFLTDTAGILPEGCPPEQRETLLVSRRDLHGFFQAFYSALYAHPDHFGLPLVEDDSYVEGEPNGTAHKAELNRKLKKPRELIAAGLDFVMEAGLLGKLDGEALVFEIHEKPSRSLQTFFKALETAGLKIVDSDDTIKLSSTSFPAMMPALQALAQACAGYPEARLGAFHFARCDFRALQPGFIPNPLDLYRCSSPEDYECAATLHNYFIGKHYRANVTISSMAAWLVQYQGKRQIKATPFFQVEYQERYRNPFTLSIKPASTPRILALIFNQSQMLQEDFFRRVYRCQGARCNWCKNNKTLGPTSLEYKGQPVTVCWYANPAVTVDKNTIALVEEYEQMHAGLDA